MGPPRQPQSWLAGKQGLRALLQPYDSKQSKIGTFQGFGLMVFSSFETSKYVLYVYTMEPEGKSCGP